jgi:phage-related protein
MLYKRAKEETIEALSEVVQLLEEPRSISPGESMESLISEMRSLKESIGELSNAIHTLINIISSQQQFLTQK